MAESLSFPRDLAECHRLMAQQQALFAGLEQRPAEQQALLAVMEQQHAEQHALFAEQQRRYTDLEQIAASFRLES
jgi:hypothetical protein